MTGSEDHDNSKNQPSDHSEHLSFLKTSSAAEFLAFQPTGRGDFRKRCLNFSVGHRRGTRRGRMC